MVLYHASLTFSIMCRSIKVSKITNVITVIICTTPTLGTAQRRTSINLKSHSHHCLSLKYPVIHIQITPTHPTLVLFHLYPQAFIILIQHCNCFILLFVYLSIMSIVFIFSVTFFFSLFF